MRADKHRADRGGKHAVAVEGGKKRKAGFYLIICIVVLAALALGVRAAMAAIGEKQIFESETSIKEEVPESDEFVEKFGESERANFLFLGVADGMTDTIMVASYDMKNQRVDLISVPRDTYYTRPGYSGAWSKINSIYHSKKGGVGEVAKAVSDLLDGMPIHYYMLVKYEGVANIVDAIGGVRFNVPFHMKYDDSTPGKELYVDIPGGEQLITKKNVVGFLRFRQTNPWYKRQGYKDYGTMDIGRMETHQAFMKEAFKQSLGLGLPKVAAAVMDNVESDLDMDMVWKLVTRVGGLDTANIASYTLPGEPKMREGASVWLLDEEGIEEILDEVYNRSAAGEGGEGADPSDDGGAAEDEAS